MGQVKLKTLLTAGFAAMLVLLLIVGSVAVASLRSLSSGLEDLADRRIPLVVAYGQLHITELGIRASTLQLFSMEAPRPQNTAALDDLVSQREIQWRTIDEAFATVSSLPNHTEAGRNNFNELKSALDDWRNAYIKFDANLKKFADANRESAAAAFQRARYELIGLYAGVRPLTARLTAAIDAARAHQVESVGKDSARALNTTRFAVDLTFGLVVAGAFLSVLIGVGIFRLLIKQVGGEPAYANELLRVVASGDLTVRFSLRPGDSVSMLYMLKEMVGRLRTMIDTISSIAINIAADSKELSAGAESVAVASASQSQTAALMAASVEELTVSINHVSDSANNANKIACASGESARKGAETIYSVVNDIDRIASEFAVAAANIEELGSHSLEIASVVNIIREVADQTNLLALNAAIEAARAGEQGRGFAVVADEVRKLAERTAASTVDIADIVAKIGAGTKHAAAGIQKQSESVKTTVKLSGEAGHAVEEINTSSSKVVRAVDEISSSLSEQSAASTDIAKNVERIAVMSEDNTTAVRQAANAAHNLTARASELQDAVSQFKV
ncbi:MAG: methyl-accepting chemotaxis protein [Candidatus Accumulibacter sp.]|nr:methyl-accepting chemotaxis protein [Accumulibacter sp.]